MNYLKLSLLEKIMSSMRGRIVNNKPQIYTTIKYAQGHEMQKRNRIFFDQTNKKDLK